MRTDVVFNNGSQWQKKDVIKLVTVSIIMLHYIDISNGRVIKAFTSIPALFYSYKHCVSEDDLPLKFSSITTPFILYVMLEAVATFSKLDVADIILYIALKICLIEVMRWKMNEKEMQKDKEKQRCIMKEKTAVSEVSTRRKLSTSADTIMDVTQSNRTRREQTEYHTISTLKEGTGPLTLSPMEISVTPYCPWSDEREQTAKKHTNDSSSTQTSSMVYEKQEMRKAAGDWQDINSTSKQSTRTLPTIETKTVKSSSSLTSVLEPAPSGEDLITNPMFTVEFPRFGHKRWKKVTMSNVTQRKIIWSLRSNMGDYLTATPTAGVLRPGEHDAVKVFITDMCNRNGKR